MGPLRFLAWDAAGSVLWVGSYLGAGYLFSSELDRVGRYALRLGTGLIVLLVCGLAAYVGWKYHERRRLRHELRIARVTPEEVFEKIKAGDKLAVVDLRGPIEFAADPATVVGALRMLPEEVERRHQEIPRDRDVVLYCT
jgi:hypothetical protein